MFTFFHMPVGLSRVRNPSPGTDTPRMDHVIEKNRLYSFWPSCFAPIH